MVIEKGRAVVRLYRDNCLKVYLYMVGFIMAIYTGSIQNVVMDTNTAIRDEKYKLENKNFDELDVLTGV